jgi:murein L,D-transpeptidase YafK
MGSDSRQRQSLLRLLTLTLCCVFLVGIIWSTSSSTSEIIPGENADRILVQKHAHTLTLFRGDQPIKTYRVALGRGGQGQKFQAGDNRVPEGEYRIVGRNPHSAFHLALRIGYPTPEQVSQARQHGVDPGGDIMIHGIRNGLGWIGPLQREVDWTKGCIAVTDSEIEEIWRLVPDQTPIEIQP